MIEIGRYSNFSRFEASARNGGKVIFGNGLRKCSAIKLFQTVGLSQSTYITQSYFLVDQGIGRSDNPGDHSQG